MAFEQPCLLIDAANCANPHALFPKIQQEQLSSVFVVSVEVLYRFRDAMKKLPEWLDELNIDCAIITAFNHLFDYDDEQENNDIIEHAWELMKTAAKEKKIIVGVHQKHLGYAKKYCDVLWDIQSGAKGLS